LLSPELNLYKRIGSTNSAHGECEMNNKIALFVVGMALNCTAPMPAAASPKQNVADRIEDRIDRREDRRDHREDRRDRREDRRDRRR
jgi:hypothetical protein